jgi:hypothetical protein
MTAWNRSRCLPASLRRRVNLVRAAWREWFGPYRKRWSTRVLLGVESLEARVLLDASPDRLGLSALVGDLAQFRNDATTSTLTLVNRGQSSQPNAPMLTDVMSQWTTLTTDYNKTWQDIGHVQLAALQTAQEGFNTLLTKLGIGRPDQAPSLSPTAANTSDSIATDSSLPRNDATSPPPATTAPVKKLQPLLLPPPSPPPSPPPVLQFSSAVGSVMEGGAINLVITLSAPNNNQTVSVNYATQDGTAVAGKDYGALNNVLTFPPGATMEFLTVFTSDDNAVNEPSPETLTMTLSNPVNATLGSQTTETVNIMEDSDGGSSSTLPPSLAAAPTCNDG